MKLFTTIIAAACIFASVSTGNAQTNRPGPYVSGFLGMTNAKDSAIFTDISGGGIADETVSFDPGIYTGVTGGYDFGYVRLEGEISYKHSGMSEIKDNTGVNSYRNVDGDVGVLATMFNAFFDLHNDSPVTPYFGGGIGVATIYISDSYATAGTTRQHLYSKDDDSVFAYQVGAGAEIALRPRYSLDIGYRYFSADKASFTNGLFLSHGLKMESHNVAVGFRVKF